MTLAVCALARAAHPQASFPPPTKDQLRLEQKIHFQLDDAEAAHIARALKENTLNGPYMKCRAALSGELGFAYEGQIEGWPESVTDYSIDRSYENPAGQKLFTDAAFAKRIVSDVYRNTSDTTPATFFDKYWNECKGTTR